MTDDAPLFPESEDTRAAREAFEQASQDKDLTDFKVQRHLQALYDTFCHERLMDSVYGVDRPASSPLDRILKPSYFLHNRQVVNTQERQALLDKAVALTIEHQVKASAYRQKYGLSEELAVMTQAGCKLAGLMPALRDAQITPEEIDAVIQQGKEKRLDGLV